MVVASQTGGNMVVAFLAAGRMIMAPSFCGRRLSTLNLTDRRPRQITRELNHRLTAGTKVVASLVDCDKRLSTLRLPDRLHRQTSRQQLNMMASLTGGRWLPITSLTNRSFRQTTRELNHKSTGPLAHRLTAGNMMVASLAGRRWISILSLINRCVRQTTRHLTDNPIFIYHLFVVIEIEVISLMISSNKFNF
jgi:hypothetical protein